MTTIAIVLTIFAVAAFGLFLARKKLGGRPLPAALRPGQPLPAFSLRNEHGDTVGTQQLKGQPAVILFVRGSWCPFCSKQVKNLTAHYKEIVDLGAKLILITPKPLDTTRRVAEFFSVDFEFWLDESLEVSRNLGLLIEDGVPRNQQEAFGADTLWPTSLVVDADGVIRMAEISKMIADRPNPDKLLRSLRTIA